MRPLTIRPERIDAKHLTGGRAPAVTASRRAEGDAVHRHYALAGLAAPGRVQLNGGDPADDADRLTAIAEDLLAPEINAEIAEETT